MYHDSGLCGFLKGADRIYNKKASLTEDLKFMMFIDSKHPKEYKTGKISLILARLNQVAFFPDITKYNKGYRNSWMKKTTCQTGSGIMILIGNDEMG